MSSKINISGIIKGHFLTLSGASETKISKRDLLTFMVCPILLAVLSVVFSFRFTDQLTSLLVNFGAIFTALLFSVLVLVYDQGDKIEEKIALDKSSPILQVKKQLLEELYYNICYSIVLSLTLVVSCLFETVSRAKTFHITLDSEVYIISLNEYLFGPLVVLVMIHLMLTILMIVKRMHTLLTTK